MNKASLLDRKQIKIMKLKLKDNWEVVDDRKIRGQFIFKNFPEAIDFVNKIVKIAEKLDHHPDISIHYNKVIIEIWTHKVEGLIELDFDLAEKIGRLK
ncbi:MAG: 4a-hydroxytetrahydrobiopterin dehydratase [Patescibacteria group bacterium]|nr:4a-hydroxytetrahydrobiopterin dehydratase [Patescibacteria group bacterium]